MRLACPECAAEYDVPEAALGAARRLRCTACGTSWDWTAETTPRPAPEPPAPELAEPAAAPRAPAEPSPGNAAPQGPPTEAARIDGPRIDGPRIEVAREERIAAAPPASRAGTRGGGVALAWILSLAILLAAAAALYAWRAPVMAAWPPATRLYAALGLA